MHLVSFRRHHEDERKAGNAQCEMRSRATGSSMVVGPRLPARIDVSRLSIGAYENCPSSDNVSQTTPSVLLRKGTHVSNMLVAVERNPDGELLELVDLG